MQMHSNTHRGSAVVPALLLTLAWALCLGGSPVHAKKSKPFEIRELSDGVHLFIPTDLGEDGLDRTNSLVIQQAKGLVVVGAQPTADAAGELLAAIDRKFDAEIRYLILTHPTVIASGGGSAFPPSTEVISSVEFLETMDNPEFDAAAELRPLKGKDWQAPAIRRPGVAFRGQAILEDPRHPVVIEMMTPAYSPGSVSVRLPEDQVSFVGPIIFEPKTVPYSNVADIGAWISTLNRLLSRREVGCIPRVGAPATRQAIQLNRDAFAWLRGHIESAFLKRTPVVEIPAYVLNADKLEEYFGRDDRDRLEVLIQQALSEAIRERKKRGIPTP